MGTHAHRLFIPVHGQAPVFTEDGSERGLGPFKASVHQTSESPAQAISRPLGIEKPNEMRVSQTIHRRVQETACNMNTYPTLADYPNNRSAHQLQLYKRTGVGECSCDAWHLEGASEASVIRNHQLHVANHEPLDE